MRFRHLELSSVFNNFTTILTVPTTFPWQSHSPAQRVVLEAWLTLIEGLVSACVTCQKQVSYVSLRHHSSFVQVQPDVLHIQYDICEQFVKCPGSQFGAVCLSHYILPMLQQWLRREAKHGLFC